MSNGILPLPPFHLESRLIHSRDKLVKELVEGENSIDTNTEYSFIVFNGREEKERQPSILKRIFINSQKHYVPEHEREIAADFLENTINPAQFFGLGYKELHPELIQRYNFAHKMGHVQYIVLLMRKLKERKALPIGAQRILVPSPFGEDRDKIEISRPITAREYDLDCEDLSRTSITSYLRYYLRKMIAPTSFYLPYYGKTPTTDTNTRFRLEKQIGDINLFSMRTIKTDENDDEDKDEEIPENDSWSD